MDTSRICLFCMEDKGSAQDCPHCGRDHAPHKGPLYLAPGTLLRDKYVVGRVLGHGGFGITYLAFDSDLNVKLAVKEYLPSELATRADGQAVVTAFTGDKGRFFEQGLEKFLEEARTLAQFESHPTIVTVKDYFRENNTAYFVMPYLEGVILTQYLKNKGGKVSFNMALKILLPVLDALRVVHKAGLLHRDVSPANIFISREGQVKLLDFGAARQSTGERSQSLSVILKPGFAPAEQYASKGKHGPWSDVYSVAATLYRAVTGITPPEAVQRMTEDTLATPSSLGAILPPEAEDAVMDALAVRVEDRIPNVEEFQNRLTAALVTQSLGLSSAMGPLTEAPAAPVDETDMATQASTMASGQEPTLKSGQAEATAAEEAASADLGDAPHALGKGWGVAGFLAFALLCLGACAAGFWAVNDAMRRLPALRDSATYLDLTAAADTELRNGLMLAAQGEASGQAEVPDQANSHLDNTANLLRSCIDFVLSQEEGDLIMEQVGEVQACQVLLARKAELDQAVRSAIDEQLRPAADGLEQSLSEAALRAGQEGQAEAARIALGLNQRLGRGLRIMERLDQGQDPATLESIRGHLQELAPSLERLDQITQDNGLHGIYEAVMANLGTLSSGLDQYQAVSDSSSAFREQELEPLLRRVSERMDVIRQTARQRMDAPGFGRLVDKLAFARVVFEFAAAFSVMLLPLFMILLYMGRSGIRQRMMQLRQLKARTG